MARTRQRLHLGHAAGSDRPPIDEENDMQRGWIRRARLAACALAVGLLFLAPDARAQGISEVEDALRHTDGILERAGEIVRESDSRRARDLLERAFGVQSSAWKAFRDRNLRLAASLTMEARDLGKRALRLAREDTALQSRAQRELENAWRALQRAREQLGTSPDERTVRLLQEAHHQIERGRQQALEQHHEAALRLALSAQRLIRQGMGVGSDTGGAERVQRELERTDRLIERAREAVSETDLPEARRALERAVQIQRSAWEAYRGRHFRRALSATKEARQLAARALKLALGPVDAERVQRAIRETDRILARASEIVENSGDEHAMRILERAREYQSDAKVVFADGRMRVALGKTRVAAGLAKRAIRVVQGGAEL
jgi:hypothetical protein